MMIGKLLILFGLLCGQTISNPPPDEQNNGHELEPLVDEHQPLVDEHEPLVDEHEPLSKESPVENQEEDAPTTSETTNDINDSTINSNMKESTIATKSNEAAESSGPNSSEDHSIITTVTPREVMKNESFVSGGGDGRSKRETPDPDGCNYDFEVQYRYYIIGGFVGFELILGSGLLFASIRNIWTHCKSKNNKQYDARENVLLKNKTVYPAHGTSKNSMKINSLSMTKRK